MSKGTTYLLKGRLLLEQEELERDNFRDTLPVLPDICSWRFRHGENVDSGTDVRWDDKFDIVSIPQSSQVTNVRAWIPDKNKFTTIARVIDRREALQIAADAALEISSRLCDRPDLIPLHARPRVVTKDIVRRTIGLDDDTAERFNKVLDRAQLELIQGFNDELERRGQSWRVRASEERILWDLDGNVREDA